MSNKSNEEKGSEEGDDENPPIIGENPPENPTEGDPMFQRHEIDEPHEEGEEEGKDEEEKEEESKHEENKGKLDLGEEDNSEMDVDEGEDEDDDEDDDEMIDESGSELNKPQNYDDVFGEEEDEEEKDSDPEIYSEDEDDEDEEEESVAGEEEEEPEEKIEDQHEPQGDVKIQPFEIIGSGGAEGQDPLNEPLLPKPKLRMLKMAAPQVMQTKPNEVPAKAPEKEKPNAQKRKQDELQQYDFGKDDRAGKPGEKPEIVKASFWRQVTSCCKRKGEKKKEDVEKKPTEEPVTSGKSEIEKQFKNRVIVRYCFVVLIPLFLLGIFFAMYFFTKKDGSFQYEISNATTVNVNLTRCLLYVNKDPKDGVVSGQYFVTFSLMALFNETMEQSAALINYDEENNELNISVTSVKENIKSCHINLNLPSKLINTLRIDCYDKCYINQEYNTIIVDDMIIYSEDDVYTNFRRIEAKTLEMDADKGILQLNSFKISDSATVNLNYGDIILQSESDLDIDWKNQQQAFCFAAPNVQSNSENCAISGDASTADLAKSEECQGKTMVCENNDCSSVVSKFTLKQMIGNLYVNRINQPFIDLDYQYSKPPTVTKGAIYDSGVSFEPFVLAGLQDMQAQASEMATDSIFILQLGKKYLQSQTNSFWTVISNPSFAYLRPWWLATFSLSLLTANSYTVKGYLAPGLCPYHIEYNREDIYTVQTYLNNYFAINNSIISYIDEAFQPVPPVQHKNGTGFYDFEKDRPITEKWYSVFVSQEGLLEVNSNDISANGFILAALILSFVFAAFVGATVFMIFKAAVMITYKETWEKAMHTKNYVNYVKEDSKKNDNKPKKKKFNVAGILEESSFSEFMKKVPRLSAFVGFYSLNLVRKYFIDSVGEFLGFLMNPNLTTEYEKANKGIGEPKHIEMKERTLKNYYEKFCFLNGLTEKQLSDPENLKKFEEYGYELIDETEALSKAFSKMQLLEEPEGLDKSTIMKAEDSLEVFISNCVRSTNAETDTEFVDEFVEKFYVFCDKYRLTRKDVRVDELTGGIKYKFGQTIISRKKLVRKIKADSKEPQKQEKFSFYVWFKNLAMKIVTLGQYVDKKTLQGKYVIDEEPLNYHFDILLKPEDLALFKELEAKESELKGKDKELKVTKINVINKMIYHSYWYYWILMDAVMIFIQQLVTAACIMPFFMLVLLQEITYSPYSIIDPDYLITNEDLMDNPWQIPGNIEYFNLWNIIIISICIFFMVYSFLDCLIYFCYARFPEDRAFEQNQEIIKKNQVIKYLTNFQWLLIFFIVFCYSSYVGLVCVWLLLGAIINPNNFLVYSTAAVTFLTFISSKYQAFQKISDDGFKMIKDQVFKIIQGQIKSIMKFMIEEVKELTAIGKDMLNSDAAKFAFEKADALGLGDEIAAIKNLAEKTMDPDKLVNNAISAGNSFLQDPNAMIDKLKQAKDELKDKAINVFKTKCKSHNIPEELVDILLSLNFKDDEKLKECLSLLVENKSQDILGQKINRHLFKSILDLIVHPKNIKDFSELARIVTQELIANLVELFIVKAIDQYKIKYPDSKEVPAIEPEKKEEKSIEVEKKSPDVEVKNYRDLILSSFNMISNLKNRNPKGVVQDTRKLIKNFSSNGDGKSMEQLLELLEIVMTLKNEAQYKQKILRFLYDNKLNDNLFEMLAAVFFSAPEEQIQNVGKKKYQKSEQIKGLVVDTFKNGYIVKPEQPEFLGIMSSFIVKVIKNQVDATEIKDAAAGLNTFLANVWKDKSIKVPPAEELEKGLQIIPAMINTGKDVTSFWVNIASKYELELSQITELIMLITENYWQHFAHKRITELTDSAIIPIIADKLKMSVEELLGFIAMFYGDFDEQSVVDFVNSLIDYEKKAFPTRFRNNLREIIKILFNTNNGFMIYSQLRMMGVPNKDAFEFLKTQSLLDDFMCNILKIDKKLDMNEEIKKVEDPNNKPQDKSKDKTPLNMKEDFLRALLELIQIQADMIPVLIEFIQRIVKLLSVKKIFKSDIRRNIEIKNAVTQFAEKYNYDNNGLEFLLYIMMGDFTHSITGFQYFLEGQEDFPFKLNSFQQIVKTILNEDRMLKGYVLKNYINKWLPSEMEKDGAFLDVLAKSFSDVFWYGFDLTDFSQKLFVYGMEKPEVEKPKKGEDGKVLVMQAEELKKEEERSKEIELMKQRVFGFYHLSEIYSFAKFKQGDGVAQFFPIITQKIQGTEELIIDEKTVEVAFDENKNPNECFHKADSIMQEKLSEQKINDFEKTFGMLSKLLFDRNVNPKDVIDLFFSNEKKRNSSINWMNPENVQKYFFIYSFINNKSTTSEFFDFNSKMIMNRTENIDYAAEVNRILKYYFTTDGEVFARGIIQNFSEFVGKLQDLIDIFSIGSMNPSIESLSNILNVPSGEIESSFNLYSYYYAENLNEKLEILKNNEKWLKKLNIDFNEFSLILKLVYNEMDPYDFSKFVSAFSLNKQVHNKVLQSIFSLYTKTESFGNNFESFVKMSEDRSIIFEAIGIDPSFGDLVCDINEGNFFNLSKIILCNKKLSQIKIFPSYENDKNPKNVIETISAFVGMVTNNSRPSMKIPEMFSKFFAKTMKLGNNIETAAYLLYCQFQISPLVTLLALDDKNAAHLAKKKDEVMYTKIIHIMKAIDKMTLKEKNNLAEKEFQFEIDQNANEGFSVSSGKEKEKKQHFFNEILGSKTLSRKGSQLSTPKNPQKKATFSKQNLEEGNEAESEEKIADEANAEFFDSYEYLVAMGRCLNERLEEVYEEEYKKSTPPDEKIYLSAERYEDSDEEEAEKEEEDETKENKPEEKKVEEDETKKNKSKKREVDDDGMYIDTYFRVFDAISDANSFMAPEKIELHFRNDTYNVSKFIILSLLKKMREIYSKPRKEEVVEGEAEEKKDEKKGAEKKKLDKQALAEEKKKKEQEEISKENASYKKMIEFGLNMDLLFSTSEKMKLLHEEYESFADFDKNALLKFLIPIFFFENIRNRKQVATEEEQKEGEDQTKQETEDFVMEFFFRNSFFEEEVMSDLREKMEAKKREKKSKKQKMAEILFTHPILKFYLSQKTDQNIERYQKEGFEKFRNYESLQKFIEKEDKNENNIVLPEHKKKFLLNLINWKNAHEDNKVQYEKYKFTSYEALEDYYPEESLKESADIQNVLDDFERLQQADAGTFFSASNYDIIKNYSFFHKNPKPNELSTLPFKLAPLFKNFQMMRGDSGNDIFTYLLVLFKEKSKTSKKGSTALENLLSKVSFFLKSNYNNMKLFLDFLLKKDIDYGDLENCLNKLEITPTVFYGLGVLHLRMAAVLNPTKTSPQVYLANVPEALEILIRPPFENAKVANKKFLPLPRTKNQRIRDLFQKTSFTKGQKDSLVLLLNCFCGEPPSWKKMLYEMNLKGFLGNRDYRNEPIIKKKKDITSEKEEFVDFLEIINLFLDTAKKPFKTSVLTSRTLAEFINPTTNYSKFNSDYFERNSDKKLTAYDKNNLLLIRGLVDQNYELLLRMFNEVPLFISRKIGYHHLSQRYFSLKALLLCASLGNPYKQMNEDIPRFLELQINEDDEIVKNIMGVDCDFFSSICASEGGDFSQFIKYLAVKNVKYLPLASLYCWFKLPSVSHLFNANKKCDYPERRKKISALLMYGLMQALQCLFKSNSNKKSDINSEFHSHLHHIADYLKENIKSGLEYFSEESCDCPIANVSWFNIDIQSIWDMMNQDYMEVWQKAYNENDNGKNEAGNKDFKDKFFGTCTVLRSAFASVMDYIKKEYFRENDDQNDNKKFYEPIFKFLPLLMLTSSGLSKYGVMDGLIEELFDSGKDQIDNLGAFLKGMLAGHENDEKKLQSKIDTYKTNLKLIIIGFEIIEKNKLGTDSNGKKKINDILHGMEVQKSDIISSIMMQIVSFSFSDDVNKDQLGQIFILMITQIILKLIQSKNSEVFVVEQDELDDYLTQFPEKKLPDGTFPPEFVEEQKNCILKIKKDSSQIEGVCDCLENLKTNPLHLINLVEEITDFIENYSNNSTEIKKQQIQEIASMLGSIIFPTQPETQAIIESVFNLINGDFDKLSPELFNLFNIDKKTFKIIKGLLEEFKTILKGPEAYVNQKITYLTSNLTGQNVSSLDLIKDKLKVDKDMDTKDLFKVFDADKSGKISIDEFKLLTKRLNMTLSDHRIKEIFTSVKGEEINYSQDLNEKEFEKALNYLQEKSIMLTLEYLGITKEILFGVLIWLTCLLLILFAFIFVGIAAFAIGGTFGSIINSMFPVAGGAGLGQKGEDKKSSLNMEKIKEQVEKCVEIVQSFKI